jgi:hypothetical protein
MICPTECPLLAEAGNIQTDHLFTITHGTQGGKEPGEEGQGNILKKVQGKKEDDNTPAKAKRRFRTIQRYLLHWILRKAMVYHGFRGNIQPERREN